MNTINYKTGFASYSPVVNASGLSIAIASAPFRFQDDSGVVEAGSVAFSPGDAGKNFNISVVRRKSDKKLIFYTIVQAPEVLAPLVPELNQNVDALFPFISGKVKDDGTGLDFTVKNFVTE